VVRLPAVHAAGVAAAPWAVRRRGGGRQVDGEALEIKTGTDGAAPFGGTQDLERKQDEAPECSSRRVEMLTGCIFYDRASSKVRESPSGTVSPTVNGKVWGLGKPGDQQRARII
jgi:hypothetical protein